MRAKLATTLLLVAANAGGALAQDEAFAAAARNFPYQPVTTYTVLRNGTPIGHHTLRFERNGAERVVHIDVDYNVKVLGVTAYHYSHQGREVWKGDQLQSVETTSDNNGRKYAVRAERTPAGLIVEREQPAETSAADMAFQGFAPPEVQREILPADMLPTSHWNMRQVMQSTLLNTHYGKIYKTKVTPAGRETVQIASGPVEATRYTYTGDIEMDQWFDDRGRWVRAAFKAFDGSLIEYILQE